MLGESEMVIRSLFTNGEKIDEFNQGQMIMLLDAWGNVRKIRNLAAHTEVMENHHFVEISKNFETLVESKVLDKLMIIKNDIKGKKIKMIFV